MSGNFIWFFVGLLIGGLAVWNLVLYSDKRFQESMSDTERETYLSALNRYLKRGKP